MNKDLSFEEALKNLQDIVSKLESGALTLDDAMAQFEQGIKLSRHCAKLLEHAETKVKKLALQLDGSVQEEPFEP